MSYPIEGFSAVTHDGRVIIFGGRTRNNDLCNKVWDLEGIGTTEGKLREIKCKGTIPVKQSHHAAEVYEGNMYVVRGKTNDGKLNDVVQVLNLTTFVWKDVPTTGKPPPPRVAKTCLITHKLFTFGESDCDKMHVLDIENMTWESDNFIRSVSGHAMHSLGTKLLLYGGIQRGKELNSKTIISFDTCSQAHLRLNFTDITDSVAKAVALYDFEPRPNEHHLLSFKEGDLINLLPDDEENSKTSIHWAKALRGGSLESFVQRDYIKVINETSIVRPTMLMDDRKLTKKDLGKRIQILETGDVVAVVERGNDRLGYKSIPREQFTEWEEKFIPRDEQQPIGRSHCSSCVIDEKFLFVWSGVSSNGTHLQDGWLLNTEDWSWSRISDDKPPSPGCIGTPACSIDGVAYIPDLVNLVVHCYSMLDGVWRSCKLQPIMLPPPSSSSSSSSSNETDSSDSCNEITSVTEKLTSVRTANGVNSSFAAVDEMSEARKPPMSSELAPSRERSRVSSPTRKSEATASRASAPSYVPQESIQRSPSESYVGRITPLPPVSESPSRVSEHLHIPTSIAAGEWGPSSPGWESPKRYMVNPIKLSPSCFHSGNYWEK